MKIFVLLFLLFILTCCRGLKNYTNTDLARCIVCLCHARTNCFSRINCARYSIDFDYWKTAKSPVLDDSDDPNSEKSYKKCVDDENCIFATIDQYADAIGHMDCNCDGDFNCKDRFAIHILGANCTNPTFKKSYVTRFNECAADLGVTSMYEKEGFDGCEPEMFP